MIRFMIQILAIIFANSFRKKRNNDNDHELTDFLIDPFLYHYTDYIGKGNNEKWGMKLYRCNYLIT